MQHAVVDAREWRNAADLPESVDAVAFVDGSPTPLFAAAAPLMRAGVGVWLPVTRDVSAPLVARDVKTLSSLSDLTSVVLYSDDGRVREHAEIVHALLTGDDVSFHNASATLEHAFNRPLPRTPVTIWMTSGCPTDDQVVLRRFGDDEEVVSRRL